MGLFLNWSRAISARLQVGIDPDNHGLSPFLNWAKPYHNLPWLKISGVDQTNLSSYVDDDYQLTDITGATEYGFYFLLSPVTLGALPSFNNLSMVAKWSGGAGVTGLTGLSITNLSVNLGTKRATFTINGTMANSALYFALNPASGGGPTNIVICEASKESLLDGGQIMDTDWLAFHDDFAILRMMDAQDINNSTAVDYVDLGTPTHARWGGSSKANKRKIGWPPAALAGVANGTGKPIHICVHHQLTDAAVTSLATALRDGITWTANEVRLYVEYSNEVWNDNFDQTAFCNTEGARTSGNDVFGYAAGWTTGTSNDKGRQWSGYRAAQVMEIFRTVFGTNSGSKWSGVLGTQAAATAVTTTMKTGIDRHLSADSPSNSSLVKLFSHLAIAPYIGPVPTSDSSGVGLTLNGWLTINQATFNQNLYDVLKLGAGSSSTYGSIDLYRGFWQAQKTVADGYGLAMMEYEGGYGAVVATGIQNTSPLVDAFYQFGRTQLCATLVYSMLQQFVIDTGGIASQYFPVSPNSKFGSFGAQQTYVDNAAERAIAIKAFNVGSAYP